MRKTCVIAALFLFLPSLPLQSAPMPETPAAPAAFVIDANRYAWAWAQERYYTCFGEVQVTRQPA